MEEAEGSNAPAYNEKAWENMELLLDKHLPLKKKRRRIIFFLLPLALAGGIAFFTTQQKTTKTVPVTSQKNTVAQPPSSGDNTASSTTDKVIDKTNKTPGVTITPFKNEKEQPTSVKTAEGSKSREQGQQVSSLPLPTKSYKQKEKTTGYPIHTDSRLVPAASNRKKNKPSSAINDDNVVSETKNAPAIPAPGNEPASVDNIAVINKGVDNPTESVARDSQTIAKPIVESDEKKEDTTAAAIVKTDTKKQKSKSPANSKLSINLSVGPDVSSVGLNDPGKLELQYGLGVSYAISKQLTVRTGFLAGRKIYTADSGNYKTPYTIHNLQKVDANCMVYEIPVTLIYNFAAEKKHNWFIAGGVSSYLMKKETYGYHYKNAWGTPQFYQRTYKNENSHLFSVINLSGGYQYHISDRFSIMAEPYLKIPVGGIGVGKVKLNSTGILFTAGFKPFQKRN